MSDSDDDTAEKTPEVQKPLSGKILAAIKSRFLWILIIYMEVLFTQYVLLTYLSPFFPIVADGLGLSEFSIGLIFAAYPIGAVVTGPFTAKIIEKIGGKMTVCFGLVLAGVFTVLFGLSKDTFHLDSPFQEFFFFGFALLYGSGSALAETGIMIIIENLCPEKYLARVIAMGEMIIGIGCTLGPLVGGVMFEHGGLNCKHTREGYDADPDSMFVNETDTDKKLDGCWLGTFTIMGVLALVSAILVAIVIPGKKPERGAKDENETNSREESLLADSLPSPDDRDRSDEDQFSEEKTYFQLALEYKVIPPALVFACSTITFSALTPVLALKLSGGAAPFNMNPEQVGYVWLVSSAFYMVGALTLGYFVDRQPEGSYKKYFIIQISSASAMLFMLGGWFLIGPAQLPFQPKVEYNVSMIHGVDVVTAMDRQLSWVILSQILLGAGSSMFTIPSLPAMLFFIPEENEDGDENPHRSFVTGFWVTIYSASVALGNTLGSSLYQGLGMRQQSGFLMIWCSILFVCEFVWIGFMAKYFREAKKEKRLETQTSVAMSDMPEMEKTESLQLMANEYQAPALPGSAGGKAMTTIDEKQEDYAPPEIPGDYGVLDTDNIGTEADI